MSDFGALLGSLGALAIIVLGILALLAPIFLYLTQRNTYHTRQEIRKTNTHLGKIILQIEEQNRLISQNTAIEKPTVEDPPEPTGNSVTMTCEYCGKTFKYGTSYSGKYKPCPGCQKSIFLK